MKSILVIACAGLLAAACATDPATSADAGGEKEYRTGSNIPARSREGVQTMTPEEMERARNSGAANTGRPRGG